MKNKQFSVKSRQLNTFPGVLAAIILLVTIILPPLLEADETERVYLLVRHAEKIRQGSDPELSAAGQLRAKELSGLLADAGIERIHSTDFIRTRDTVVPLAMRRGIEIELYDPSQPDELVRKLRQAGERQLIVGHSNTVPDLVQRLGGDGGPEIDEAQEYDRLYLLTVDRKGSVSTVLLRYGARFNP